MDILFKLTANEKEFVTTQRVKVLLKLLSKGDKSQQLLSLLMRFRDLNPHMVTDKLPRKALKGRGFKSRMEETFAAIWCGKNESNSPTNDAIFKVPLDIGIRSLQQDEGIKKNLRNCLIPNLSEETIQHAKSTENHKKKADKFVSIHQCQTLGDLMKNVAKLRPISQALSLLNSSHTTYLLFLTRNSVEMRERLSFTLYYTLHNEFFSMAAQKKKTPQITKRKMDLLCRINRLQDYFQQGLPVVGRFLAQYLSTWDGEEFFIEICKLLSYLQLTEFIGK